MQSTPRLRMERVCKRFGATVALDEVSLSVDAGKILALVIIHHRHGDLGGRRIVRIPQVPTYADAFGRRATKEQRREREVVPVVDVGQVLERIKTERLGRVKEPELPRPK